MDLRRRVILPTVGTFVSCIANVFFLEKLVSAAPLSSNLITFVGFLLLTIDGLFFTSKFGSVKPVVPISYYVMQVCIFFVTNVLNNLVFRFNVPMTLNMIFKSGSLLTSLILGVVLLKRRYSASKYASVLAITIGIILCTYASSQVNEREEPAEVKMMPQNSYLSAGAFSIGVMLMTITLVSSAYLGIIQERLASQFGKHPRESLFYSHALPLPFFAFLGKDIYQQAMFYCESEPTHVPLLGPIPYLWLLLICNATFQYICINCVFRLTSECTSLTVTLTITVRKFLSLLISIFYFGNPFTNIHWIGTILVFGGSAVFAGLHNYIMLGKEKRH